MMVIEDKLCKWLTAGLALYKVNPLMVETVFYDASQCGWPTFTGPQTVVDPEKLWLPDEYAGGTFRWAGQEFPIVSNTAQQLSVEGDPSAAQPIDMVPYQIVPPAAKGLIQFLQTQKIYVSTIFNQVPTSMPMLTIRLEKDAQSDTYIGENLEQYAIDGVEFDIRSQALTGSYVISVWTENREATLWLYSWAMHYALNSLPQFTTWGLYDVSLGGSDLDPALQYLAERTYTRHLLFTASRIERAVSTREPIEYVTDLCVKVCAQYAQLHATVFPAME
jgi:hypothetical protein